MAKEERNPTVEIHGALDAHQESGTEGILWAVCDDDSDKEGYDKLNVLEDGDLLTVFNDAARTDIAWQGVVDLEYERLRTPAPSNPDYVQQAVFGRWVHGFQRGLEPETWAEMFLEEKPATLVKKADAPKLEIP